MDFYHLKKNFIGVAMFQNVLKFKLKKVIN